MNKSLLFLNQLNHNDIEIIKELYQIDTISIKYADQLFQQDERIKAIAIYEQLIDKVSAKRCFDIAEIYHYGYKGIAVNHNKAICWYQQASKSSYYRGIAYSRLGELNETIDLDKAIEWYQKAYESDQSLYDIERLGSLYFKIKNYEQASNWYNLLADKWDDNTHFNSKVYDSFILIALELYLLEKQDEKHAYFYLKLAADKGNNAKAQYNLGEYLYLGIIKKEGGFDEAFSYFVKAAKQQNGDAWNTLGELFERYPAYMKRRQSLLPYDFELDVDYMKGLSQGTYETLRNTLRPDLMTSNVYSAFDCYKIASRLGHDYAKYNLGKMYLEGKAIKQDLKLAYQYLNEAISYHIYEAYYELGLYYEKYVPNLQLAYENYVQGARNNSRCANALGLFFAKGIYVNQDIDKAIEFFKKGMELKNKYSYYYYATYSKLKIQPNYQEIANCYKEAIDRGFTKAKVYYEYAEVLIKDLKQYELGFKYASIASEKGDERANILLAICYRDGLGVKKDKKQARTLLKPLVAKNNEQAKKEYKKIGFF